MASGNSLKNYSNLIVVPGQELRLQEVVNARAGGALEIGVLDNSNGRIRRPLRSFIAQRDRAQRLLTGVNGEVEHLTHNKMLAILAKQYRALLLTLTVIDGKTSGLKVGRRRALEPAHREFDILLIVLKASRMPLRHLRCRILLAKVNHTLCPLRQSNSERLSKPVHLECAAFLPSSTVTVPSSKEGAAAEVWKSPTKSFTVSGTPNRSRIYVWILFRVASLMALFCAVGAASSITNPLRTNMRTIASDKTLWCFPFKLPLLLDEIPASQASKQF